MGRLKSLLKSHELETAKGKRTCKNSGVKILRGELCLVVQDGIHAKFPYCRNTALKMIEAARERLQELEAAFSDS